MAEKKEEKKISPAIVIIPLGFGLAALGAIAMAAMAKAITGLANVHGTVTDASTGNPIPGVFITVDSSQVSSDASGNFSFAGLSTGSHHIRAEKEGYQMVSEDITLAAGDNVVNIQMTPGVTLANLSGTVTDASTGSPIPGVLITVDSLQASSDASGNFSFTGLSAGSHYCSAQKDGYQTVSEDITLVAGDNIANIQMTPAVVAPLIHTKYCDIVGVEGVPFSDVLASGSLPFDWVAFGKEMDRLTAVAAKAGSIAVAIADGVGLALCMKAKGAESQPVSKWGAILRQCGYDHPEYLTAWAKTIRPPVQSNLGQPYPVGYFGSPPQLTNWSPDYPYPPYACLSITLTKGVSHLHVDSSTPGTFYGQPCYNVITSIVYEVTWWYFYDCQGMVNNAYKAGAPFTGPIATLAQPIEMSEIRGVTLDIICNIANTPGYPITVSLQAHLWYHPEFTAAMPPPAFRGGVMCPYTKPVKMSLPATGCFAGGYYYPGIYDGQFELVLTDSTGASATCGEFAIKGLAKVTGSGTVVP